MTPVAQDRLYSTDGLGNGNCMAACLASLLDLPLWMVPPFEEMFGRGSEVVYDRIDHWLQRMFGMELGLKGRHDPAQLPEFYMASGPTVRTAATGVMHSVIYRAGELVHDPHPSGAGLIEVKFCRFLVASGRPAEAPASESNGDECWRLVESLRTSEGNSVTVLCDNPDGDCAIECCSDFTDWETKRFSGSNVKEALKAACAAMQSWTARRPVTSCLSIS